MDLSAADPAERARVEAAAVALAARFGAAPEVAVVLGSGLAGLADEADDATTLAALGLPAPGVAGHAGTVGVVRLGGARVLAVAGRVHLYEGRSPAEVARTVRALAVWGVRRLVLTAAVGALRPALVPGSLVRLVDHLNLMGTSPLVGPAFGTRFPDGAHVWDTAWGGRLDAAAARLGMPLPPAVYAAMLGPAYETPAEVRMLAALGADVVGMSTVPEALAAAALGVAVAGVGVVTNLGAGLTAAPVAHEAVAAVAGEAGPRLRALLAEALRSA